MTEIPQPFVVVCSFKPDNATVRLQSFPILHGLLVQGAFATQVDPTSEPLKIAASSWAIFHYADKLALAALRAQPRGNFKGICLASDIYGYDEYQELLDLVDLFIVPTEMHRKVLSAGIPRPVFTIPECVDPAALDDTHDGATRYPGAPPRLFWFGYSESFSKGMASLVPVIQHNLVRGRVGCFDLILNEDGFDNRFGLKTRPYEPHTFRSIARQYDYAILSHFALDLHINSLIKSPNKAISALMAGVIPLATDTPAYGDLYRRLGLESFLFSSLDDLNTLLGNLNPSDDMALIARNKVCEKLTDWYSEAAVLRTFLAALTAYSAKQDTASIAQVPWSITPKRPQHSLFTAIKRRLVG